MSKNPFDEFKEERDEMVRSAMESRDIHDSELLEAMRKVPRHYMIPGQVSISAYKDQAMSIGMQQTISQPYIVAAMTQALDLNKTSRVLEVGTGSGYQTAVLAELCKEVFSTEILPLLSHEAQEKLWNLGYRNIHFRIGDGYDGWTAFMPFDAIIVTAAPPRIPQPLIEQLREGGKMIVPLGDHHQELILISKKDGETTWENLMPVSFVPMTGKAQKYFF